MILKYKVPQKLRYRYGNKKIIYCKIEQEIKMKTCNRICYKVRMLNHKNLSNIFLDDDLEKLNILDRLKLILYKRRIK